MSSQIDSGIPVLTEVLNTPTINEAKNLSIQPEQVEKQVPPVKAYVELSEHVHTANNISPKSNDTDTEIKTEIKPEIKPDSSMNTEEWKQLENVLKENILKQVLARIDFVLEHKIRDSLAEILQVSVDKLASDIQFGLKNSLEDVVTRAVTQEIAKAKSNNPIR